ncbi:hypothetical protein M406DRAFT_340105 [Cryphonectria parasitica EP155]|uniref:ATP synthase subunit g n=1 Tax=Cryphonectria parasitica (strain ATCC 38755 / EP155) TaxID=660469 RepID=A0A9P4Y155_CRYP1|nr:uncharacterized protein M406DRAFT_340105 [Cryphonectria parasitica EP155]KAF3764515.1 hypothetical protein M406DRAFT_340105 [Cryphonectria parasitica EP155]
MSSALARPLLRRPLQPLRSIAARRFESTASSTAQKTAEGAKNAAGEYKAKAAEGLSRVTSAAGPAIAGAAKGVSNALGKVGGRTGRIIGFVERQVPFVVYYSKVGLELGKLVFRGQKMDPPSVATFQSYFNRALSAIKNPGTLLQSTASSAAATPSSAAARLQNISRAQVVGGGVLLAEVLGFFTVGEILGRFKLVGYHGETAHHH